MNLYLNKDNVIVDIVETVKPVRKANGLTVLCGQDRAEGYLGANEEVYAKMGTQLIDQYSDVAQIVEEVEVPEGVTKRTHKYIEGEFVENADPFPLENLALTEAAAQTAANLEYVAMMTGVDI